MIVTNSKSSFPWHSLHGALNIQTAVCIRKKQIAATDVREEGRLPKNGTEKCPHLSSIQKPLKTFPWSTGWFLLASFKWSLNGTHFRGDQTMQMYGNFEGFPLEDCNAVSGPGVLFHDFYACGRWQQLDWVTRILSWIYPTLVKVYILGCPWYLVNGL